MLLKRCVQCGKRKFALYHDTDICYSCYTANEEAKQAAERLAREEAEAQAAAEAKTIYDDMKTAYERSKLDTRTCTREDLYAVISSSEEFLSLVQQFPTRPHLADLFQAECSYLEQFHELIHPTYGIFKIDQNRLISFDHLIEEHQKIQAHAKRLLVRSNAYANAVSDIPELSFPILDLSEAEPKSNSIHPLKITNITSKTPLSRLSSFIVIDLETTGLSPTTAEIIQIAAVQFINFAPAKCYSTFVRPRKGLNPSAQRINGITDEDVENAPYIEQIIPALDELIGGDAPIVGHNLSFDSNFLMANGSQVLWEIAIGVRKTKCYDTLELARKTYHCSAYKLDCLCREILHIIRENSHQACSDALATGLLFQDICRRRIGTEVPDLEL